MTETAHTTTVEPLVTRLHIGKDLQDSKFTELLIKMTMAAADFAGSWSSEIIPPQASDPKDWLLVQRFRTAAQVVAWKESPERARLIEEIKQLCKDSELSVHDGEADRIAQSSVATSITTDVKPDMKDAYRNWETKIQIAQASFPGYRGSFIQPPGANSDRWTTIVRFDTPETLTKWFDCDERQKLLPEAKDFVKSTAFQNLTNSFPGWVPADDSGEPPPNWKTCMLVLLGLFPIAMLEIKFLGPQLNSFLNPGVANFICLSISVPGVSYGCMPHLIKFFKWWMYPAQDAPPSNNIKGLAVVACCAVIEIALFWNLLLPPS